MVGKIEKHIKNSSENISNIILHKEKIIKLANLIKECKKRKKSGYRNGGSASDAEILQASYFVLMHQKKELHSLQLVSAVI